MVARGSLLGLLVVGALIVAVEPLAEAELAEVQSAIDHSSQTVHELGASFDEEDGDSGLHGMAAKAHSKAEYALNKIKTAKELRGKAREVLTAKGKPIPEILQQGALDDVHQRVVDAQAKLSAKFGASPKNDGEAESKIEVKREQEDDSATEAKVAAATAKAGAESEEAKVKVEAAKKQTDMYKEKFRAEKLKEKATRDAAKVKEEGIKQKADLDQQMQKTQMNGKVMELEVKMKEKAKEKMEAVADGKPSGPVESEADFNHRQIAQEAYNKQVMGYVMTWEKTHGAPTAGAQEEQEQEEIKSSLEKFVSHYSDKHEKIKGDIDVADTDPTRKKK